MLKRLAESTQDGVLYGYVARSLSLADVFKTVAGARLWRGLRTNVPVARIFQLMKVVTRQQGGLPE